MSPLEPGPPDMRAAFRIGIGKLLDAEVQDISTL